MENNILEVLKPGLLTTIQDLGRPGYQQYGMVVAGAMDAFSLQVGNLLVGNSRQEAGLEITLMGPELRILEDAIVAICGADLSPTLDEEPVSLWKTFYVGKGKILRFGQPKAGARAYLTVAGGLDVTPVMNSKSTYVKAGIGGLNGRALQRGDIIRCAGERNLNKKIVHRGLHPDDIPHYPLAREIKVILGPDVDAFSEESKEIFLTSTYTVSNQCDRMGFRLTGSAIRHKSGADIISDAIALGTIQVPVSGEPIILLADRQTTGGYTRIATVISVDIPFVSQMRPGSKMTFKSVSLEEAQRLYLEQELFLKMLSIGAGVF